MPSNLTLVLMSLLLATPVVALWLWLVVVPVKVAILCPGKCVCATLGYTVKCDNLSVNPIPLIHFTNVQILRLSGNEINLLEKNSFVSMTELKILEITDCELRTIDLGAFNGLKTLTRLSMNGNNLSHILPGTFENMSSLEYIDLSSNRIEHLNSAVFKGLGAFNELTKLTGLSMQGNKLSEIMPGTFENKSSLEYLGISSNRIEHLDSDVFSGLVNLKSVHLTANKLKYLHPDTFLGLPKFQNLKLGKNPGLQIPTDGNFINSHSLTLLDISNCNVSSLSVETFANVSALQWLDLSYNNLTTVDINILKALPNLSTLYLNANPLQCDCQLLEVWRWCQDRNIRNVDKIGWGCINWSRWWWWDSEKNQCLECNVEYCGDYTNRVYVDTGIEEQGYENKDENIDDYVIFRKYHVAVLAFLFIFATIGNIMLLIIIICNKDMRTVPNMYILNLAISDIIYLTVFFSKALVNKKKLYREFDEIKCIFLPFCRRMSVGLSAYSVALYSFQRYRVTVDPFYVRVSPQAACRVTVATVCGVWIVAALFAVPSALSKYLCEDNWDVDLITYHQHVVIFELLVSCVLPLCVIAFSYIMTACHLVESSRPISEGTQNPQLKARRNVAKVVLGLTFVFLISYVPNHVFWTYLICSQEYNISSNIHFTFHAWASKERLKYLISTCFLSLNPCLNPVALFCTSSQFRQHLKRYLTCFCKTSSPSTDFELARRN